MDTNEFIKENFNISQETIDIVREAENVSKDYFKRADEIALFNQAKILKAFSDNRISEAHFNPTTGYGYNDIGRDAIDAVMAQVFGAEDAIVRHNIISGTHAISTAMWAVLRPGDAIVAVTGKPYDTLAGVIDSKDTGSLADFNIKYRQVDLKNDNIPDFDKIKEEILKDDVKAVIMQRSKGYAWRDTFSVNQLNGIIDFVHSVNKNIVCIVDNCYGEFSDTSEPHGDLLAGSLIKNPGGGIAQTGGYIAGKKKYVDLAADRITAIGAGRECGATLGQNRFILQGLFMAPHTTAQAIKASYLCSAAFDKLGFEVCPKVGKVHEDIITSIKFKRADLLVAFCQGIQKGAPVDSFAVPQPAPMPGYADEVIMAAGAFCQGASIELSADAPMREPYIAYIQGGLTYESAKIGIMSGIENVVRLIK